MPKHVHLLFLPAYSSELQPAEYLWPLTSDALVNAHFADLDALDEAQSALPRWSPAGPDALGSAKDPGGTDIKQVGTNCAALVTRREGR